MRRRDFLVAAAATAWPGTPSAQNRRVPVVGILTNTSNADMRVLTVPETLRGRGYVDGQNVRYEFRFGEGRTERLPDLAKELVTVGVDRASSGLRLVSSFAETSGSSGSA